MTNSNSLLILTKTWIKDSNDLLDYEANDVQEDEINCNSDVFIVRRNYQIYSISRILEDNQKALFRIEVKKNSVYKLNLGSVNDDSFSQEPAYFVTRYMKTESPQKEYRLSIGDVIKLGRIKLRLKELKLDEKDLTFIENHNNNLASLKSETRTKKKIKSSNLLILNMMKDKDHKFVFDSRIVEKKLCRICYCDENEIDSPLLIPCNCSGSMKHIHLVCLQRWLKSKIKVNSEDSSNSSNCFEIKQIECELCKSSFPDLIKYKQKSYEIWDFLRPEFKSYAIFEGLDDENQRNIYSINLDIKNKLSVGRSNDCDFKINDISVSRMHCLLIRKKDEIYITDNHSKFGTLVKIQMESFRIYEKVPLPIQIGRTFFQYFINPPWYIFCCCEKKVVKMKKSYQKQNSEKIPALRDLVVKNQDETFQENEKNFNDIISNEKRLIPDMKSQLSEDKKISKIILSENREQIGNDINPNRKNDNISDYRSVFENERVIVSDC